MFSGRSVSSRKIGQRKKGLMKTMHVTHVNNGNDEPVDYHSTRPLISFNAILFAGKCSFDMFVWARRNIHLFSSRVIRVHHVLMDGHR